LLAREGIETLAIRHNTDLFGYVNPAERERLKYEFRLVAEQKKFEQLREQMLQEEGFQKEVDTKIEEAGLDYENPDRDLRDKWAEKLGEEEAVKFLTARKYGDQEAVTKTDEYDLLKEKFAQDLRDKYLQGGDEEKLEEFDSYVRESVINHMVAREMSGAPAYVDEVFSNQTLGVFLTQTGRGLGEVGLSALSRSIESLAVREISNDPDMDSDPHARDKKADAQYLTAAIISPSIYAIVGGYKETPGLFSRYDREEAKKHLEDKGFEVKENYQWEDLGDFEAKDEDLKDLKGVKKVFAQFVGGPLPRAVRAIADAHRNILTQSFSLGYPGRNSDIIGFSRYVNNLSSIHGDMSSGNWHATNYMSNIYTSTSEAYLKGALVSYPATAKFFGTRYNYIDRIERPRLSLEGNELKVDYERIKSAVESGALEFVSDEMLRVHDTPEEFRDYLESPEGARVLAKLQADGLARYAPNLILDKGDYERIKSGVETGALRFVNDEIMRAYDTPEELMYYLDTYEGRQARAELVNEGYAALGVNERQVEVLESVTGLDLPESGRLTGHQVNEILRIVSEKYPDLLAGDKVLILGDNLKVESGPKGAAYRFANPYAVDSEAKKRLFMGLGYKGPLSLGPEDYSYIRRIDPDVVSVLLRKPKHTATDAEIMAIFDELLYGPPVKGWIRGDDGEWQQRLVTTTKPREQWTAKEWIDHSIGVADAAAEMEKIAGPGKTNTVIVDGLPYTSYAEGDEPAHYPKSVTDADLLERAEQYLANNPGEDIYREPADSGYIQVLRPLPGRETRAYLIPQPMPEQTEPVSRAEPSLTDRHGPRGYEYEGMPLPETTSQDTLQETPFYIPSELYGPRAEQIARDSKDYPIEVVTSGDPFERTVAARDVGERLEQILGSDADYSYTVDGELYINHSQENIPASYPRSISDPAVLREAEQFFNDNPTEDIYRRPIDGTDRDVQVLRPLPGKDMRAYSIPQPSTKQDYGKKPAPDATRDNTSRDIVSRDTPAPITRKPATRTPVVEPTGEVPDITQPEQDPQAEQYEKLKNKRDLLEKYAKSTEFNYERLSGLTKYFTSEGREMKSRVESAYERLNRANQELIDFEAKHREGLETGQDPVPQIKQPQAKQTQLKPQARRPVSTPSLSDTELNAITDKVQAMTALMLRQAPHQSPSLIQSSRNGILSLSTISCRIT